MKLLILNGSPRPNGNTSAMVNAFAEGAEKKGHDVTIISVAKEKIAGCMGCEYCHTKGNGECCQKDGMAEIYKELANAEILVFASPVYYFTLSAQIQAVIHRTYALGVPPALKKMALLLSSVSDGVYDAAIWQYQQIADYFEVEDSGIVTAYGNQNKSEQKMEELYCFGYNI